ncbi:late embryogenesis abundant protein 31-like, partial [Asparagus officinalis]
DQSDAASIQAAEARATGLGTAAPGGIAARAQGAAESNAGADRSVDEEKVALRDVLDDATTKLAKDKVVTREDAERVKEAEGRNNPSEEEAGVSIAMEAASRMNKPGVV